jgi:phospholipid/cholesterol/gamma-HCH transport system substrate-binding protein
VALMRESDPRFANLERRIGLFLLASALIVAGAVAFVGVRQGLFTPKTEAVFFDESGRDIVEGMEVVTRGLRIGTVRSIRLQETGKVEVTLAIERPHFRWIRQDSTARIDAKVFIGDARVEISPGTPQAPPLLPGGVIAFVRDPELAEVAKKAMEEVKPVLLAVKSLIEYLDDPQGDVKQSVANVRRISAGLVETRERIDETLARVSARVDAIAGDLEALSSSLQGELLPQVSALVGDGRQLVGDSRLLVGDTRQLIGEAGGAVRSVDAFMREDLRAITADLQDELIPQLRALLADADRAAAGAGEGVARVNRELPAILEKVNSSLENIRAATGELVPASREAAELLREGGELVEDSQALVRRAQELWPFTTDQQRTGTTVEVDSYETGKPPQPRGAPAPGAR